MNTSQTIGAHRADTANCDRLFAEIMQLAARFDKHIDLPTLRRAYRFASERHKAHVRSSGEPYLVHPVHIARILVDLHLDTQTIAAGLLHDVVEDDVGTSIQEIELNFGNEIATIVDGVTKISQMQLHNREERQIDSFRKMLLAVAKDVRVLLVKFADRLHNLRTLDHLPPEKRSRIARETLDVYSPLAHRFGMARVRRELEEVAFRYVDAEAYAELETMVEQRRGELWSSIEHFCDDVRKGLAERGVPIDVSGRLKHLYSIYLKMQTQGKELSEIQDLLGVRIIVDTPDQCYDALAYLHQHYRPLEGRFKDYIGSPKPNGYQSLHTTVTDNQRTVVEVQIRTQKMHEVAEEGIARHWLYKEGRATGDIDAQTRWVRQFLEWSEDVRDPNEFYEQLKIDLFPDEIFALTPKGDVVPLTKGATALDFAFAVHTEVGLHASGANVNGRFVPLGHVLHTSDSVKITRSNSQKPSRDWLGLVKTTKARTKIRQWLRQAEFSLNMDIGCDLVEKRVKKAGLTLTDADWESVAVAFNMKDRDHLYAAVGAGDLAPERVFDHIRSVVGTPSAKETPSPKETQPSDVEVGGIVLTGMDNPMVRFAQCCNPVPGDPVLGFITRGRGLTIHHRECPNMPSLREDLGRLISVRWEAKDVVGGAGPFKTAIIVKGSDRVGLLSNVTSTIAATGANIRHAEIRTTPEVAQSAFLLEVKNLKQLKRIISKLQKVPNVTEVHRLAINGDDEDELRAMIAGNPLPLSVDDEEE
jgi:GTP pyrophosphokinase